MRPLVLAQQYMDIIYKTGELEHLRELITEDLQFEGPFYEFNSATKYINSLVSDLPEDFSYELINSYKNSSSACIIYRFSKPGISTIMTQVFEVKEDNPPDPTCFCYAGFHEVTTTYLFGDLWCLPWFVNFFYIPYLVSPQLPTVFFL